MTDVNPMRMTRANLKDEVAARLREAIYSGKLRPGSKIDQDEVAAQLGVSKLPVREALITIESEGLVRAVPRRGAFVAPLTPDDILDHYHIYGLVSGIAAGRAALALDDEQLDHLGHVLSELRGETSASRQGDLNDEFHRIVNRAGGGRRLKAVILSLSNTLPERFYSMASGWGDIANDQHDRILAALRARDAVEADRATVDHIRSGGEYAVQVLGELGLWDESVGSTSLQPIGNTPTF